MARTWFFPSNTNCLSRSLLTYPRSFMMCFATAVLVGIGSFTQSAEAGLIHHSIKVKNTTSGTANILLVTADGDERRATINSNSEHTFSIGPKCAKFLKGGVSSNYAYGEKAIDPKYPYYCVRSGRATDRPALCVMSCSSSSHKISLITLYNGSQVYTFESE